MKSADKLASLEGNAEVFSAAQVLVSWNAQLRACNQAFADLQDEKKVGWTSTSVDQYWRAKDRQFAGQVDRQMTRKNGGHKSGKSAGVPSTAKYVRFYRAWMDQLDPLLFARPIQGDTPGRRVVCDIGSSPGGMCEFLVGELGFRGYAFSLACEQEGFGMSFAHPLLKYADCDAAKDDAWRFMLERVSAGSCDFVNGGIVVDRGQKACTHHR